MKAQLPSCWGVPTPAVLKFSYNKGTIRPPCCSTAGCSWHVCHSFLTGLCRAAAGKAPLISSHSFQGSSGAQSQSSDIQREKRDELPALQLKQQQGAMHVVGVSVTSMEKLGLEFSHLCF